MAETDERVPAATILLVFLRLGCSSFGGPLAHLGYFRSELVERRKWLNDALFADIVALAQTLPGPASSQVGFTIGLLKGGWSGGLAAWFGFTLPSALLLIAFAYGREGLNGWVAEAVVHGLQLVAFAVVAQAVLNMQRALAPDGSRATMAVLSAAAFLLVPGGFGAMAAIALGALCGLFVHLQPQAQGQEIMRPGAPIRHSRRSGALALLIYAVLLIATPLMARSNLLLTLFDAFYRTGALVFGGGHVVLPLLESTLVARGIVDQRTFLAGYGAAQAIPGPLFAFSAYLGATAGGIAGAVVSLLAIFLPGMLLVAGILPFWAVLMALPSVRAALRGINAAVVGVLAGALYSPIWTSSVRSATDFSIALAGFLLLVAWRMAPWLVVLLTAAITVLLAAF